MTQLQDAMNKTSTVPPLVLTPKTAAAEAVAAMKVLFWCGLSLQFLGAIIAAASWPATDTATIYAEQTGSGAGAFFGLLLASIGSILIMVAVIAWGARLGILATRQPTPAPIATAQPEMKTQAPDAVLTRDAGDGTISQSARGSV